MSKFVELTLPSGCRLYNDVDPAKVKIRTLQGKDQKLLAELNYDNFERKILALLENVVQGIKPEDLTVGDRLYILVWEAINSFGRSYPIQAVCEHCGSPVNVDVDLAQINSVELDPSYMEPYSVELRDGHSIKMRLYRVRDEIKVADFEKAGKNAFLYRLGISLTDDRRNDIERMMVLEESDADDIARMRAFHTKFEHGPKMEYKYECPDCGGVGLTPVPFRIDFILPVGETLKGYTADDVRPNVPSGDVAS